jgi:hypothetical protein
MALLVDGTAAGAAVPVVGAVVGSVAAAVGSVTSSGVVAGGVVHPLSTNRTDRKIASSDFFMVVLSFICDFVVIEISVRNRSGGTVP